MAANVTLFVFSDQSQNTKLQRNKVAIVGELTGKLQYLDSELKTWNSLELSMPIYAGPAGTLIRTGQDSRSRIFFKGSAESVVIEPNSRLLIVERGDKVELDLTQGRAQFEGSSDSIRFAKNGKSVASLNIPEESVKLDDKIPVAPLVWLEPSADVIQELTDSAPDPIQLKWNTKTAGQLEVLLGQSLTTMKVIQKYASEEGQASLAVPVGSFFIQARLVSAGGKEEGLGPLLRIENRQIELLRMLTPSADQVIIQESEAALPLEFRWITGLAVQKCQLSLTKDGKTLFTEELTSAEGNKLWFKELKLQGLGDYKWFVKLWLNDKSSWSETLTGALQVVKKVDEIEELFLTEPKSNDLKGLDPHRPVRFAWKPLSKKTSSPFAFYSAELFWSGDREDEGQMVLVEYLRSKTPYVQLSLGKSGFYNLKIKARDKASTELSKTLTFRFYAEVKQRPRWPDTRDLLTLSDDGLGNLTAKWEKPSEFSKFNVKLIARAGLPNEIQTTEPQVIFKRLTPGSYKIQIQALDLKGETIPPAIEGQWIIKNESPVAAPIFKKVEVK